MEKKAFATLNIYTDDHDRLKEIAKQEHRTMAKQISHWIEQHIKLQDSA